MGVLQSATYNILLVLVHFGYIPINDAAFLTCYYGTMENSFTTPMETPLPLLNSTSCIDTSKKTVLYIHGYNGNSTKPDTVAIVGSYLCLGSYNVLFFDWADEANEGYLGPIFGYPGAVSNVYKMGENLAAALLKLNEAGLDLNKLHIVGHSLGAQVAGVTGLVINAGKKPVIGRITGLDPAGPLFRETEKKFNKNCAKFVDALHTDPRGYGDEESVGTVDFWANFNPGRVVQPGCPYFTLDETFCSHERSVKFFQESILNKTAFACSSQPDYFTWMQKNGTTDRVEFLGEFTSQDASGNFYFITNDQPPYGKGMDGLCPSYSRK